MQNLNPLASLYSWAGQFESYLVRNPKDRFSHNKAHFMMTNLHESYVAVLGLELATPWMKSDYKPDAQPTVLPGPAFTQTDFMVKCTV